MCCIRKLGAVFPISGASEEDIREQFLAKNLEIELEPITPDEAREIRKELNQDIFFQT